jgi:hypothetical protein
MQFLKRILKQPEAEVAAVLREERRGSRRHPINPEFPLQAVLSFVGRDQQGQLMGSRSTGWNWKGRLINLSEAGASMQLAPSVLAARGDTCDLKLSLQGLALEIPCHITNVRVEQEGVFFGLRHDIADTDTLRAYLQLLDIVSLGTALKLHSKKTKPDESGYLVEQYASDLPSRLTVWRDKSDKSVAAFEFLLKDCLVRAAAGHSVEYLSGTNAEEARPAPTMKALEIHQLFGWVVPNLAPAVPKDIREFMEACAAA